MRGTGTLRDERATTAWRDRAAVQAAIPRPSDEAIDATIAYAEYLYQRYGRFPAGTGPFRTVEAYQAHHLDLDFYDRFYQAGAVTEAHRHHMEHWHSADTKATKTGGATA
jgi:hypothetical protein